MVSTAGAWLAQATSRLLAWLNQAASRLLSPMAARLPGRRPRTSSRRRPLSPPAFFVASFAGLIAIGTLGLLTLPGLHAGPRLGFLDALFTMTSAVCVTGLIVVDTATTFTFWGQLWILLFIQLGGIGLITLTTMIIGALGRVLSLRAERTSVVFPHRSNQVRVWQLAGRVTRFTLRVEAVGAIVLLLLWLPHLGARAVWHAVFHSISAFCNAGFSTFSDSLEGFARSPLTLIAVSALVITGGLGFVVIDELRAWRTSRRRGVSKRLSSHTYAVAATTLALLAGGAVWYAVFEWNGVLGGLALHERVVNAWFMSVTARTAGFNSVPYGELGNASALLTILLMFVGGSPGSMAGGIKTTTLAVLVALAWSRIRSRHHVELHGRGVPLDTIERTVGIVLLATTVLVAAFFALTATTGDQALGAQAHAGFLPLAFETMSAFATVGLSMGVTSALGSASEAVVIVLMFVGRVGLLSFFSAFVVRQRPGADYRPAMEDLVVG
jgi:trk system potassium uptake protein